MRRLAVAITVFVCTLIAVAAVADQQFTVVFSQQSIPADAAEAVEAAGGQVVASIPEIGVMEVAGPVALLDVLNGRSDVAAASPSIEWKLPESHAIPFVEGDQIETVNTGAADLYRRYQWDIKQVTANGASFLINPGSHDTVVGVIDTGISTLHPALQANILGGQNFVKDGPGGTLVPTDIEDRNGHGSQVAGTIAANGRVLGVGPELGLRIYRVFGKSGGASTSSIVSAIATAVHDGVDVISMSLGGFDALAPYTWTDPNTGRVYRGQDVGSFLAYRRAVAYAVRNGAVVVAAAGNEGFNIGNPAIVIAYLNWEYGEYGYAFQGAGRETPGTTTGVVTVSATGPTTSLASYSNYGNPIDIAAPGGDFLRYPAPDYYLDMCLNAYKNGSYVWMAGTSQATPKVSAVAALIIDQARKAGVRLTPAQVVARLYQTATDLGKPGVDPYYGSGAANALSALTQ